jgi:hypothetical protein
MRGHGSIRQTRKHFCMPFPCYSEDSLSGTVVYFPRKHIMNPELQREQDLEHARWMVDFRRSLLEIHGRSYSRGTEEWRRQEAQHLDNLSKAEATLDRIQESQAIMTSSREHP